MKRRTQIKQQQSIPPELRYTVNDFNQEFPDDDACLEHIKEGRWPNGIARCAKCKQDRKHHRVSGRKAYACDYCGNHIYPLAGTIFEKTSTPLRLWFHAMYQMGSTRCGISAKQIQRETGVTYKTAWRMFRQIRMLLEEGDLQLEGPTVEMDQTYMGGRRKYGAGRKMVGDKKQVAVAAIVERKGRVVARTIADEKGSSLLPLVREYVLPESTIFTDEWKAYEGIRVMRRKDGEPAKYRHRRIKHSARIYVRGDVHTNTIEGFWSLVKRGIGGVYHSVSQKYLQSYLNEYSFRYNPKE